jgi:6,7-dimethyl-8-ribityllumazine synthase
MATILKNMSLYDPSKVPSAEGMRVAIVVAEWNIEITSNMCKAACETLVKHGVIEGDIEILYVPGSFELTSGCKWVAETQEVDAVIAIGTVIQGETRHFDYICQSVSYGMTELNLTYDIPFIFGVLTTESMEQAQERAGGKHGNKGIEAAITAIKMVALKEDME